MLNRGLTLDFTWGVPIIFHTVMGMKNKFASHFADIKLYFTTIFIEKSVSE